MNISSATQVTKKIFDLNKYTKMLRPGASDVSYKMISLFFMSLYNTRPSYVAALKFAQKISFVSFCSSPTLSHFHSIFYYLIKTQLE